MASSHEETNVYLETGKAGGPEVCRWKVVVAMVIIIIIVIVTWLVLF
jgi:hypothetical protein